MICECGGEMKSEGGTSSTLVGYMRAACGQRHDDNCLKRWYVCAACGNGKTVSLQRSCTACDWRGKMTCFCHPGEKVRVWP